MKKFISVPSNSQTVTNYTILNFLLCGLCASMMRGAITVYSKTFEENVRYIVIFILLSTAGQLITGLVSDFFRDRHLLVQISVMFVCGGFLFPQRFGLVWRVILAGIGYALFCTSAGASILSRSDPGKIRGYAIFSSIGGISTAVMMTRPIIGYPMVIVAMFVACATDRKGMEYQETLEVEDCSSACAEHCLHKKGSNRLFALAVLGALLVAGSYGLFFLHIDNFLFLDFGKNYGMVITAVTFCLGRLAGGMLSDRISPVITGVVGSVGSAFLLIIGGSKPVLLFAAAFLGLSFSASASVICSVFGRKHYGIALGLFTAPAALAYFSSQPYYRMLLPVEGTLRVIFLSLLALLPVVSFFIFNQFQKKKNTSVMLPVYVLCFDTRIL